MCRAATQHAHTSDSSALELLFASDGWATMCALAESSGPARGSRSNGFGNGNGNENGGAGRFAADTPTPQFGQMGIDSPPRQGGSGSGSGMQATSDNGGGHEADIGGGAKVCPHCTFENDTGASDCDMCGLPLSG